MEPVCVIYHGTGGARARALYVRVYAHIHICTCPHATNALTHSPTPARGVQLD